MESYFSRFARVALSVRSLKMNVVGASSPNAPPARAASFGEILHTPPLLARVGRAVELSFGGAPLMMHVNNRAVDKLGPILLPAVESVSDAAEHAALSPERATPPAAPVFLLHGAEDNVIPSVETVLLANYLRGKTEVHAVLSGSRLAVTFMPSTTKETRPRLPKRHSFSRRTSSRQNGGMRDR